MSKKLPKSGEYLEGKLWFAHRGGQVAIGLTDRAVQELGALQDIEFPEQGEEFEKGDVVITVEGSTGRIEVTAPAAGTVQEINEAAQDEPEIVTEDPLEEGWLIKVELRAEDQDSEDREDASDDEEEDEDDGEDDDDYSSDSPADAYDNA